MSTQDIDLIFPSNTEISMFMDCFSSLLVSLLTSWLLPTTAQVTIEAVPPIAVEGETVLLFVHNLPENVQVLSWYTGLAALKSCEIERYVIATKSHEVGPAYSSRETILRNGSLMIKSVNKKDSGYYTLKILSTTSSSEIIHAEFFVHSPLLGYKTHRTPSQMTIEVSQSRVFETDHIILVGYNLPEKILGFAWHKGVLPLDHFKIASHSFITNSSMLGSPYHQRIITCDDGSMMFFNVTQKDSGLYTLRAISVDLVTEWAILDLRVNKPGSQASNNQAPESKPVTWTPKKQRRKGSKCYSLRRVPNK
ncbi:carcinoembryonic antigen-related cell adhesion molecule 3-like [Rattus rattus]|uniref:carcinoembryonic antigen-related cell adhesion molecule 3-like n=1 Tax=Rattus rattus TaxID=10117 RepID=UPI0013F33A47|nr:carcinoembryonic antigen-related cell adhesion molecule 3-like [Rattus rattus]